MISNKSIFSSFLWICSLAWASVGQAALIEDQIAESLRLRLQTDFAPMQIHVAGVRLHSSGDLIRFYGERNYRPAWSGATGPLPQVNALINLVANAANEGLRPADYHNVKLNQILSQVYSGGQPQLGQLMDLDLLLTDAFLTYGSHLLNGRNFARKAVQYTPPEPRYRDLVAVLQQALQSGGITEALNSLASPHPNYKRLRDALVYYRSIDRAGGWPHVPSGAKLKKGSRSARIKPLRARLQATGRSCV